LNDLIDWAANNRRQYRRRQLKRNC
jgi:hypothetical protein